MQSETKDLRAHIRNALAATQVTKLWLGGAAARPICSPARFGGVGKGEGLGAPTDRGALSPMAVGVKHADSRYSGCECLWYRRKYRIASAQPAIVRVHLFASLNCTGPGSRDPAAGAPRMCSSCCDGATVGGKRPVPEPPAHAVPAHRGAVRGTARSGLEASCAVPNALGAHQDSAHQAPALSESETVACCR